MHPQCLHQLIPIFLVFLYLSYREHFISFAHSILGKLFAIWLIILYTTMDPYFGLLTTSFILVFYYVNGFRETFAELEDKEKEQLEKLKEKEKKKTMFLGWSFPKWMLPNVLREEDIKEGLCNKEHFIDTTHKCNGKCKMSLFDKKKLAQDNVSKKCQQCI